MASIKCPGCGREISSFAEKCNYCGYQISAGRQNHSAAGSGGTNQYQAEEKKSGSKKFVAIAIPIVIIVMAYIGRSEQNRLQQKAAQESRDASELDIASAADVLILQERYLMYSDTGGDQYVTVYYGSDSQSDSDIVKELLYEVFIVKDAVSDYIDPENYSLSDFEVFYESFPDSPNINVQDIGNYYLLTIDYSGLDNADEVAELVSFGVVEWAGEGDYDGRLIEASFYMQSLEKKGFEKGYFQDKEYAAYFGSGKP